MKPSRIIWKLCITLLLLLEIPGCKKARTIYLVPVGNVSMQEINDLASHYQQKFGVGVKILPAFKIDQTMVDTQRDQLIAERVLQAMVLMNSIYRDNDADPLIGITGEDMYPLGEDWQFCFGWRGMEDHAAVVSTARMSLHYIGEPEAEANLRTRLRKVVTKDIGLLLYGKTVSDNPKSVLYDGILGIEELDQVTEEF
jgi:predicted Zn-dependent protease